MNNQNNKSKLQCQLNGYVDTYDKLTDYLGAETNEVKRRMAFQQRKHALSMMLSLRMQMKLPESA